jgi:hypothetical protein
VDVTIATHVQPYDVSRSIVLTGQGHWCEELADGLAHYSGLCVGLAAFDRTSAALNPGRWLKLAGARIVVLVGFRPGARTRSGALFDWAFSLVSRFGPAKQVVHYWIGSDVQRTLLDHRNGRLDEPRFERAVAEAYHFAGSARLAKDLREVGVEAEVLDFPWMGILEDAAPLPMPSCFTVLSYVPDARFEFYGGPVIIEAARAVPSAQFLIVGGNGDWIADVPVNVKFLGWQKDMRPVYEAASCIVRMVEYDSVGATVIEALVYGRKVIYSCPFEHTTLVGFGDAARLAEVIGELAEGYMGGSAQPDREASAWALANFDAKRLFDGVAERLVGLLAVQDGPAGKQK